MEYKNEDTKIVGGVVMKKGISGAIVSAIAISVMSSFHDMTIEQKNAGTIVLIGVLESLRNSLKRKFPRFFSFF